MSLPDVIAIGLGLALTAYAILAGADFGAGILDLTSGRSPEQRSAIARTIGPVWEANHVWLIYSITILFSAFPKGFAALGDGPARAAHACRDGDRRARRRVRPAHGGS